MRKIFEATALVGLLALPVLAQNDRANRGVDRVPAGTEIAVRINEDVDAKHPADSKIYTATVARDVADRTGKTVIERGANAELVMRNIDDQNIVLDLQSVEANGRLYRVAAEEETVVGESDRREGVGKNQRTGKYLGGGAVIGSIIGAIAGGGKGAAIGAATGAGAGAATQVATRGGAVRLPAESLVTFRLERALRIVDRDDTRSRRR